MKSPTGTKKRRLLFLSVCLPVFLATDDASAFYRNKEPLPAHLKKVGRSVWRLQATLLHPEKKETEIHSGSGFFVRPEFEEEPDGNTGENIHYLMTGFHTVHKILKDGAPLESVSVIPPAWTEYKTLTVDKLTAVSGAEDLALLRVRGSAPAPLPVRESLSADDEDLVLLGWPGGFFRVMKKAGLLTSIQHYQYFPVDFSGLEGVSGGPVIDRDGRVGGVAFSAIDNFLFFSKADSLKGFLKGERGIYCGDATSRDCLKQAETELVKTGEAGGAVALFILFGLYSYGGITVAKDITKAFKLMKVLAENGIASAQRDLAHRCLYGLGTDRDIPCAVDYAKKSAEQGFAPGRFLLAKMYSAGDGVEKNNQTAFELVLSAAESGLSSAQHATGLRYFSGTGVEKNIPLAVNWIKKSAQQGFAPAKHLLGHLHYKGLGVEKSIPLSVRLWEEAARLGDKDARFSFALLIYTGEAESEGGPKQDTSLALQLINLLADGGYSPAETFLLSHPAP